MARDQNRQVLRWLQTSMGVFQSAASSADFFQKAAQAVVDIIGLDTGRVLLLEHDDWQTRAFAAGSPQTAEDDWRPSLSVLNKVRCEKRTFWELPSIAAEQKNSLIGVNAVVATPLLAANGEVIGAVYGDRRRAGSLLGPELISELEAMLVELIASGVAAGMARLRARAGRATARVQFEQFFTRELSEQLRPATRSAGRPGRRSLAPVLRYSRFQPHQRTPGSARDGAMDRRRRWACFRTAFWPMRGVLVDYIGDELVAMWGAPAAQPEHARLACLRGDRHAQGGAGHQSAMERDTARADGAGDRGQLRNCPSGQHGIASQIQVRAAGQYGQPGQPRARRHRSTCARRS